MKQLKIFLLLLLAAISCKEKKVKAYTGYHLERNLMVSMITDVVLAEGNEKVLTKYGFKNPVLLDSSYQFIYTRYHIERWQMDSSFKYYANRPGDFTSIMEEVIENLNRLEN